MTTPELMASAGKCYWQVLGSATRLVGKESWGEGGGAREIVCRWQEENKNEGDSVPLAGRKLTPPPHEAKGRSDARRKRSEPEEVDVGCLEVEEVDCRVIE